jgi:hypothetical protein
MRTGSHTGRGVIQPAFKNARDGCRMSRGGVYPRPILNATGRKFQNKVTKVYLGEGERVDAESSAQNVLHLALG